MKTKWHEGSFDLTITVNGGTTALMGYTHIFYHTLYYVRSQ